MAASLTEREMEREREVEREDWSAARSYTLAGGRNQPPAAPQNPAFFSAFGACLDSHPIGSKPTQRETPSSTTRQAP